MQNRFGAVFGAVIAYILLGLYAGTVGWMIYKVIGWGTDGTPEPFGAGLIYVVTSIGGLVSALVVSKLAITVPGENPGAVRAVEDSPPRQRKAVMTAIVLYLTIWLLVGLSALIVGTFFFPDSSQTLSDIGTGWLGVAIASGYAYFGLKPAVK